MRAAPRVSLRVMRPKPAAGYFVLSVTAAVGVGATMAAITRNLGVAGVIDVVSRAQVNLLKMALYDDYAAGLFSLRYCAIIAGGIGLQKMLAPSAEDRRRGLGPRMLDLFNIGVLLVCGLISSRLSIVCGLTTAALLACAKGTLVRSHWRRGVVLGVVAFALLTVMNYSRNAGYYRQFYGVRNPVAMNLIELERYLGEPWGISASAAQITWSSPSRGPQWEEAFRLTAPIGATDEYLELADDRGQWYRRYVNADVGITPPSAFVEIVGRAGVGGLFVILGLYFLWSMVFGWALRQGEAVQVIIGPIFYAFAELWRLHIFDDGIFATLIALPVAAAVFSAVVSGTVPRPAAAWQGPDGPPRYDPPPEEWDPGEPADPHDGEDVPEIAATRSDGGELDRGEPPAAEP